MRSNISGLYNSILSNMDVTQSEYNGSCLVAQHFDVDSVNPIDNTKSKQAEFWMTVIISFLIAVITLVGIPGNVLNAVVFYRLGLGERINLCLFTLAVVSLVHLLALLLNHPETFYRRAIGPLWVVEAYSTGAFGTAWASQFLSAVIASERCFCVVSPFHAKRLLKTSTMAAIIVVCCVVLVGGMAAIAGPKHRRACVFHPDTEVTEDIEYVTEYYLQNKRILDIFDIYVYATGLSGIFLLVIIVTTVITAIKLRAAVAWRLTAVQKTTTAVTSTQSDTDGKLSNKEVSVTLMLMTSSVLFTVCITATLIIQICRITVPDFNYDGQYVMLISSLWRIAYLFWTLNSSLNFFVYFKMGSNFREQVLAIVGFRKQCIHCSFAYMS